MAPNALHLFVTVIAVSSIVSMISTLPASRARVMLHGNSSPYDTLQINEEGTFKGNVESLYEEFFFLRRMDLEINRDYPGSGANNRHTPFPPAKE